MRIRLLSERGGHPVGAEIEVSAEDTAAAAWLANQDAERLPDLPAAPPVSEPEGVSEPEAATKAQADRSPVDA